MLPKGIVYETLKIIKILIIVISSYFTTRKIMNQKKGEKDNNIVLTILNMLSALIYYLLRKTTGLIPATFVLVGMLSAALCKTTNKKLGYIIFCTVISWTINNVLFAISSAIIFIPCKILNVSNVYIISLLINLQYLVLIFLFFRIKKIKNGFDFLNINTNNEYFENLLFNISAIILFSLILIANYDKNKTGDFLIGFMIFSIIMFVTIKKSFQSYYKQKLLEQELSKVKADLEEKTKEVKELEAENIKISKNAHTLVHKQKSLAHKIEEMMLKAEISTEEAAEARERLAEIGKDLYKEKTTIELDKTEIPEIDDMLKYMQSECKKNKIDFQLQLKGNIHHMINNLISKSDLETLLADHIKNAIIAINHTDNPNRSILVKLGKTDETYGLYIYDSGIEFEKETLENLGKKPSTTHKDEGGTGMGFMNTFDTLRKYNASLIIEEFGEPDKDNYTKVIMFKFDNKNEFKVFNKNDIIVEKVDKKGGKNMAEFWDIYDKQRNKTGKLAERGVDKLNEGEYHIVVVALILNSNNEILITRRAPTKKVEPLKWELTGGSIVAGETSLNGILREVREEIGLNFTPEETIFLTSIRRDEIAHNFKDIWLFKKDLKIQDITFADGEAIEAKWVTIEEFLQLKENNETVSTIDFGRNEYELALTKI